MPDFPKQNGYFTYLTISTRTELLSADLVSLNKFGSAIILMKYQVTLTIAAAFGFAAVQSAVTEYSNQKIFPDPKETNGVQFFSKVSVTKGSNLRSHISENNTDSNLAYVPESISTVLHIDGVGVNTTVASVVGIEVTTTVSSVDRAPLFRMEASVYGAEITTTVFSVDGGPVSSTVEGMNGVAPKDSFLSIPITQTDKVDGTTALMLRAGKGSMALKSATSSLINEKGASLASPGVGQGGFLDSKTNAGVFKETKAKIKSPSRKPSNIPSKKPSHKVGQGGIPNSKSKNGAWSKMKKSKNKQMFPKREPPSMPSKKPSKIPSKRPSTIPSMKPSQIPSTKPSKIPSAAPFVKN